MRSVSFVQSGNSVSPVTFGTSLLTASVFKRLSARIYMNAVYSIFNDDPPADYKTHSLSVSDVVIMNQNGDMKAYFVDRFGFQECKLRSNGMPVPLLRNCYSIFNGTKYR